MGKYLDSTGLAQVWNKIKSNFVSKASNGNVTITGNLTTKTIEVEEGNINVRQGGVYAEGDIEAGTTVLGSRIQINGGTSDQILLGDGSTTSLQTIKNSISAIPKFRTIVVNSLPADEESKSESAIYLVKSGNDAQNLYTEYIWINNAWEKLGEQKVNLDNYLTTSNLAVEVYDDTENEIYVRLNSKNSGFGEAMLPISSPTKAGLMSTTDKTKLNGIETGANKYVLPNASASAIGGVKINTTANSSPVVTIGSQGGGENRTYYVQVSSTANGLLVVTVPWENTTYGTATTSTAGLMSAADKTKLNNFEGALTESEIAAILV
jgi:hypothetical protein